MRADPAATVDRPSSRLSATACGVGRRVCLLLTRIGGLFLVLQAYTAFRKRYFLRPAEVAFDHARDLLALERTLHLDVELGLQRWALQHPWAIDAGNLYYRQLKPILYGSAALALLLAPVAFHRIGRAMIIATLLAWPWYALYPLAPPRFMAPYGFPFVDTLAAAAPVVTPPGGGANPYAAMPSMHIGWSTLVALWLAAALPWWRIGLVLGVLHLTMMSYAVVVTGNHYVLDVAGGLAIAGTALLIDRRFPLAGIRRRRRADLTRLDPPEREPGPW